MIVMLCRNDVRDYEKWRAVFNGDAEAHNSVGLTLAWIARDQSAPNVIFFAFNVADLAKAKSFIAAPDAKQQAERSGVIGGDYHFIETVQGY